MLKLLKPRWRKVVRDILDNKARTVLVVLAIAVGVFAFGSVFITQEVLLDDMNNGFVSTNPANVIVSMSPFDESLLRTVRTIDGVADAEARALATVRMWDGENWVSLQMYAVPDLEDLTIGKINLEEDDLSYFRMSDFSFETIRAANGSLDPQRRDILFERRSIPAVPGLGVGDTVLIELPDSTQRELTVTGVVHDFNAPPGNIAPQLTGYVTIDTLQQLGLSDRYSELHVIADPERYQTTEELEAFAEQLEEILDRQGYGVGFAQVQQSDQHWASDLVTALVTVLGAIGFLALGLSALLVFNTTTAILSAQTRQIGMMKAIGARGGDILAIYAVMSGTFGVLSLGVALPLGILISYVLTFALGYFLNIELTAINFFDFAFSVPLYVVVLQMVTAIITPLLAAGIPIFMGTRITVREAVSDYGIGTSAEARGFGAWVGRSIDNTVNWIISLFRFLPRPTLLSLRNTFRRKMRLALTVITLSLAGSIFISVLDVRGSLLGEFDNILNLFGYDVAFFLNEGEQVSRLQREASRIEEVDRVEGWGFAQGTYIRDDGEDGLSFIIFAPPADTPFIKPDIIEGRWLEKGDTNAIVVSTEILKTESDIEVGDIIKMDLGATTRRMEVVGIVNLVGIEFAYADFDYITRAQGAAGQSFAAIVGLKPQPTNPVLDALGIKSSPLAYHSAMAREIEDQYKSNGIQVGFSQITQQLIGTLQSSVNVLVGFMLFMAFLLAVVGGLGLASTMSLNVLERTREIGVMRAIGAADGAVRSVFLTEGLVIGVLSWAIAVLISIPIATQFAAAIGQSFFERPLDYVFVPAAPILWFIIVMAISAAASLLPSNRAAQVSVRESLAYE